MGKIIKNGFTFMEYANSGLIRKIDDIPELKNQLITLSELKTHLQLSNYGLLLAEHILLISGMEMTNEISDCFIALKRWQNKEIKFPEALEVAGNLNRLALNESDAIKVKVLRAFGQLAAIPHVRWHALVASEYAVVIVNLLYPKSLDKVKEERINQIKMMTKV